MPHGREQKGREQKEGGPWPFDDIRPYHDGEVRGALDQLVRDPSLTGFMGGWLAPRSYRLCPPLARCLIALYLKREFRGVADIRGFQAVIAKYAEKLVSEGTTEFRYEGFDRLTPGEARLFVSNHRDIAGDSMLLNYALYLNGLDTARIAIGDNLAQVDFATQIMRLNKGFFIKRSVEGPRKAYAALMQSSRYISHSIEEGQSVWIAQSEGRSKDGFDVTDPAIIKMFLLSRRKAPIDESLSELKITPLSISYELDPCDLVKAREQCVIDKTGAYRKPEGEDLRSLVTGLSGQKGRVILRLGEQVGGDFASAEEVAAEIDRQIVERMELFPINYWAVTRLDAEPYLSLHEEARAALGNAGVTPPARFAQCPREHLPFLLRMYANPVVNRKKVTGSV